MDDRESQVHATMAAINRSWRENHPSEMGPFLHPHVTMVLPGFSGSIAGKDLLLSSFVEFCSHARVLEYRESDEQIQVVETTGFVSYRFDMLYERASKRARSSGRDVWAFVLSEGKWLAVWRLMTEVNEVPEATE